MCRETGEDNDLIRLALSPDGVVVVDLRARLPGRGAWLHPRCVSNAPKRAGSLRKDWGSVDLAAVPDLVKSQIHRALLDGLSLAAASGALVGGFAVLTAALAAGRIVSVVVADDASERTISGLSAAAGGDIPLVVVPLGKEALGERVGSGSRAALGVTSSRSATHLRRQLRRLRSLG